MDTSDAAVLTGGGDGNLRLFNLEDLSLRCSLRGHAAPHLVMRQAPPTRHSRDDRRDDPGE